jgi:hypothetical protein
MAKCARLASPRSRTGGRRKHGLERAKIVTKERNSSRFHGAFITPSHRLESLIR